MDCVGEPGAGGQPAAYLSICAIYRDEAPYLREWVEFHRLVGVERFFLYDNGSVDDHHSMLAPLIEDGTVTLHEWPVFPGQVQAYDHALREHGPETRWMAFLDLDEFLFSPTGRPLPEILADYEQWPAVGANWAVFGTSGHKHKPDGLVIESYLWRCLQSQEGNRHIKSIVDPSRTLECRDPHHFAYADGAQAVDENEQPIRYARNAAGSWNRLRVNHYFTRSEDEFRAKLEKGKADKPEGRGAALANLRRIVDSLHEEKDETILSYLPALREALAGRATSRD
jgi:glycosyl transferase family 92